LKQRGADFCIFHLTGRAIADPMSNFGVVNSALSYIDVLIGLVPGAREKLPTLAKSTELAGVINAGLPCAGVPLAVGTMDAWSGILGAGARRDCDAVYLSGTSEVLGLVSETRIPTPGVIAFPKCEGIVLHAGPTQAGGAFVAWQSQVLGRSSEELSSLVENREANKATPVFLPHLEGERAPLWDPASRASFSGMDSTTGPADLACAMFEDVSYSVRLLLESLETSSGVKPDALTLAGGGMRSDIWCQIRADILGRPPRRQS
jgi:xylulokinase